MPENSQRKPAGSGLKRSHKSRSTGTIPRQQSSQKQVGSKVGISQNESSQHQNSGKYKGKPNVRKVEIS